MANLSYNHCKGNFEYLVGEELFIETGRKGMVSKGTIVEIEEFVDGYGHTVINAVTDKIDRNTGKGYRFNCRLFEARPVEKEVGKGFGPISRLDEK